MIVMLAGGMGNQMFQYAFGRSVSSIRREPLFFEPCGLGPGCERAYSLSAFNVTVNWANGMEGGSTVSGASDMIPTCTTPFSAASFRATGRRKNTSPIASCARSYRYEIP